MRSPATTLCCAVVWRTANARHVVRWLAVGDCELRLITRDKSIAPLYSAPRGAPSNVTRSLPGNLDQIETKTELVEGGILIVGSDGMFRAIDRDHERWGQRISEQVEGRRVAGSFAQELQVPYSGLHDDRTLIAIDLPRRTD